MASKVEEQLQEQTAGTAFQLVIGGLKAVGVRIADENAIQHGMKEYARKFLDRYGNVKILNMDQPVPLREVYVAAQVVSSRFLHSFSSLDELHDSFLREGQRSLLSESRKGNKRDCLELANEKQFLNVLGAPGAGKSTFLRRLGLEALQPRRAWGNFILKSLGLRAGLEDNEYSRYSHDCLPVLVELRRFKVDEIDLVQLIRDELATCGLPDSDKLVDALLESGRLLVLFDGVDEIPGDRIDKFIAYMSDFVVRYDRNRFVISCRTAFYNNYFSRFSDVVLTDFDDKQIESFVTNWFRSEQDRERGTAAEFLRLLRHPSNASARELSSTPLLLTFLCLTFDDRQRLPPNRSDLYRQALEILMERWAAFKRVHNEPVYRDLHPRLEVQMLAEIAAPAFRESRYFFTRGELVGQITGFLRNELNAPKHLDGDKVLNAIEIQQGLIVQRAQDAWSFSHLTLQEYLTAVWCESNRQINGVVDRYIFDVRWREVFILLAGVVDKADDLLKRMQRVIERRLSDTPRLAQLVRWSSSKATLAKTAEQTAARRFFALALAFDHSLAVDRSLGRALDYDNPRALIYDRARTIAYSLDYALSRDHTHAFGSGLNVQLRQPPDAVLSQKALVGHARQVMSCMRDLVSLQPLSGKWHEASQAVQGVYDSLGDCAVYDDAFKAWKQVLEVFSQALQLPSFMPISTQECNGLVECLYAYQLIVDCKNGATRVGRPAWEQVCRRMFNEAAS